MRPTMVNRARAGSHSPLPWTKRELGQGLAEVVDADGERVTGPILAGDAAVILAHVQMRWALAGAKATIGRIAEIARAALGEEND